MALLRWIIALPFIVGAVLFSLAHPEKVSVTFNPLQDPVELPLYFVALLFLGVGFILGALMAWIGMGEIRKDRRKQKKEIKKLLKEKEEIEEKLLEALSERTSTPMIEGK